ncbi:alpha-galactosidase [Mucilaginibacter ginsenosidivorans]|uniref:Alpha-galactosidase n=1 Tax=Mucilaginibacter ginsenosidivorans TaxID=398053 RepID=A0A5B8UT52_9SPHI|nr:alpha-galactosidase [Mucilaginibacter ginsenosidivorans]QEC62068.1 alpha-galactosidase [Mucilaginibacter ginsenosidivorans]
MRSLHIIYKYCSLLFAALQFIVALPVVAQNNASPVRIPFGKTRFIKYDLKTGLMNVYKNNEAVFSNVYAEVKIDERLTSSKDYKKRTYTETAISNGLGKGEKYIIKLTGPDLPEMDLIFYTYPNREYFLIETEIKGDHLQSNYMAPFSGSFKAVPRDARTLFVPFDNDTFIGYNAKPFNDTLRNVSAEVGAVYDNDSRRGIVVGSIEHGLWKTGVLTASTKDGIDSVKVWSGYTAAEITRDKMPHGIIRGATLKSALIFVGCFDDWRHGLEEYGKANRIADPPYIFNWTNPTPVGWNSWGVIQDKLTLDKALKVVDFFADSLAGFRTGNTAFIDLDSYWDNMLHGGMSGDFSKLKEFAGYCMKKGLQPGVYWAPFTDWGYKNGADRLAEGGNYKFGDMWTKVAGGYHDLDGARALDPTHPGTKQRIAFMIKKLRDCGFKMIKIDFLGHAAIESTRFYDTTVTTGMQAYRKGMEFLLDQLSNQMLVYAAISPGLATGRYAHMRRIACDAFKSINDTKYTLNSLNYGWWQTYLYNYIDADHVVLSTEKEGANRARILSAIITGTFITGDDFSINGHWSAVAKSMYQNPEILKIIKNGKAFEPVEGNTGSGAAEMFTRKIGNDFYLAVFNYADKPKVFPIDLKRLGLPSEKKYTVSEIFSGNKDVLEINVDAASAELYKFSY